MKKTKSKPNKMNTPVNGKVAAYGKDAAPFKKGGSIKKKK